MNRHTATLSTAITLCALLFWAFPAEAKPRLLIATSDYLPFSSTSLPHNGFVNHVVSEAYRRMNIEVAYESVSWARGYKDTREGKYDATSFWYADKKHDAHFITGPAITNERLVFFKHKKTKVKAWQDYDDLKGYRIGLTRGYTYTKGLWEYAENNEFYISIVNSDTVNLKMLLLDRIDLFPIGELTGWSILEREFPSSHHHLIDTVDKELAHMTGHILFPKSLPNSQDLANQLSEGVKRMEQDGSLDKFKELLISGYYRPIDEPSKANH